MCFDEGDMNIHKEIDAVLTHAAPVRRKYFYSVVTDPFQKQRAWTIMVRRNEIYFIIK